MTRPWVGLLGGTFDPIHNGHLEAARAAARALALDEVRFLPAAHPPHRAEQPQASGLHRLEMVRLAIAGERGWQVSDLELHRSGPSYTFDTLAALHREGLAPQQLFFVLGADAFADIATWHRYPDVLDAAHFVVVTRPGTSFEEVRERVPTLVDRMGAPDVVAEATTTRIVLIEAVTPDVSSTAIRHRVARGEPIDGMVPPAVAAYIREHDLYRHSSGPPAGSDDSQASRGSSAASRRVATAAFASARVAPGAPVAPATPVTPVAPGLTPSGSQLA